MPHEIDRSLGFLPAALAEGQRDRPFVAIVRSRDELCHWLGDPLPGLQWLQVEGLLRDPDAWVSAAHGASHIPLDVILSKQMSEKYRRIAAFQKPVIMFLAIDQSRQKRLLTNSLLELPSRAY